MRHYRYRRLFPVAIIIMAALLFHCAKKPGSPPEVFRDQPLVATGGMVSLEKLFSIDVTEISLFNKDNKFDQSISFDGEEKIYIADGFKRKIYKYDERGNFLDSFGGPGQGPNEFPGAISKILVDDERLRVFHSFFQIKDLTLAGEYLSGATHTIENQFKTRIVSGRYYVLRGITPDFKKLDLVISEYDGSLSNRRDLFVYPYPPGLGGAQYDFLFSNWMHVSERGGIYFPEAVLERYSLLHLDGNGTLVKKFGRTYEIVKYSSEAETRFQRLYKTWIDLGQISFPAQPPVIRLMFEDERGNVWVVAGETYEDNGNPDFENTVDIFNPKGEWLYSLKTKIVSRYVLYNKGKIYRVRVMDEEPYKQFIDVYKIAYND